MSSRTTSAFLFWCAAALVASAFFTTSLFAELPSTASEPFEKTHIYNDRVGGTTSADHQDRYEYPPELQSSAFLLNKNSAPFAYFNSFGKDATTIAALDFQNIHIHDWVEYEPSPPRYANHVVLLLMASDVFNGSGGYDDHGKPICTVSTTWDDGTIETQTLAIGTDVRNYQLGTFCSELLPYYILQPTNALPAWTDGIHFFDAHELNISPDRRSCKLARIRIDAAQITHNCEDKGVFFFATTEIFGISSWADFETFNASSVPIVKQRQNQPAPWHSDGYGGYRPDGATATVDASVTIGALGCCLTSYAMVNEFFGVRPGGTSCTPRVLNEYLQQHKGYFDEELVTVVSLPTGPQMEGQVVQVRDIPPRTKAAKSGTFIIVDEGPYAGPLATLRLDGVASPSTGLRNAVIVKRHNTTTDMAVNQIGRRYTRVIHSKASDDYSSHVWRSVPAQGAAAVENAIARSQPVILNVDSGNHWIVGRGLQAGRDVGDPGTYKVHDPAYDTEVLDFHRVHNGPDNEFTNAFRCVLNTGTLTPDGALASHESTDSGGLLCMAVTGNVTVDVATPGGAAVHFNPSTSGYETEIPGAIALHAVRDENLDDPALSSEPYEFLELPDTPNGDYQVTVNAPDSADFAIQVVDFDSDDHASDAVHAGRVTSGSVGFTVGYSSVPGSQVTITPDVTSVGPRSENGVEVALLAGPNPASSFCRFRYHLASAAHVRLAVFDVQGKRVATLLDGTEPGGDRSTEWRLRAADGQRVSDGVYFARLEVGSKITTRRLVVLRNP